MLSLPGAYFLTNRSSFGRSAAAVKPIASWRLLGVKRGAGFVFPANTPSFGQVRFERSREDSSDGGHAGAMKRPVVHIVGAGAAGLAAAQALLSSGRCGVVVHEAKPYPGGRRRSFYDAALGVDMDTGNFPLLAGFRSTLALIEAAGARGEWREERKPGGAFADFATGERWRISPNRGRAPWWLFSQRRRGRRFRLADYLAARRLLRAAPEATVLSCAPAGIGLDRLWRPLALAALNSPPETASARLAGSVLGELLRAGGAAMRLLTPVSCFGRAFIEPVTKRLAREGATLRFDRKLVSIDPGPERAAALEFEHDRIDLGPRDAAILATPWPASAALVPGLPQPAQATAIVTVHFAASPPDRKSTRLNSS